MSSLVGPESDSPHRVDAVAQQLIEQLRLKAGRLPGERQLAAQLGCSRNTIREALARLRDRGLVDVRPRRGVYDATRAVAATRATPSPEQALLALQLVGPEVAHLVAGRFDDAYMERLEEITSDLSRALLDRDAGAAGRRLVEFYVELARLAGNSYLHQVLVAVATDEALVLSPEPAPEQRAVEAFFTQHVDVLQALRRGDRRRVGRLVERCIHAWASLVHLTPSTTPADRGGAT
ncbi:MAG: FadR family transcriptional regulator [Rhodovulum sp.]|nr:FadR family transcriptional regulator [Rhodovulum sp.]